MPKPVLVSGIQPTGKLHLGNYLGALKNFVELQSSGKYKCFFFVADLHALTENPEATNLQENILGLAADFMAVGLDPEKSVIFQQSRLAVPTELAWILNTITPMGELSRMTQFKDKSRNAVVKNVVNDKVGQILQVEIQDANVGLFDYPVLMAADIVLYDAAFVPVGDDQRQHLELTRTLVRKFNQRFGETFKEPKELLTKAARVMSLKDPAKKMSKSDPSGCIFLDDSPDTIKEKIKRAVTDSGSNIFYDPQNKPALSNMIGIWSALTGKDVKEAEECFGGKSYSEFKAELAETIVKHFAEFRSRKAALMKKPAVLKRVLNEGSAKAAKVAEKKMKAVRERIGIAV